MTQNAFEKICMRASSGRWCWNLWCTTCGHAAFKYAFFQLAAGTHPGSPEWVSPGNLREASKRLRVVSRLWLVSIEGQATLCEVLSAASVASISERCSFPDWLGYLGLGLFHTREHEVKTRTLTRAWLPQLLELLPTDSSSAQYFQEMLSADGLLRWSDLERIERDLLETRHSQGHMRT